MDKLTVPHFLDCLKQINLLLAQFPGPSPQQSFNNKELKGMFYFTKPNRWHTNFISSSQSLHTTTLDVLKTYMVHQEQKNDTHYVAKTKRITDKMVMDGTLTRDLVRITIQTLQASPHLLRVTPRGRKSAWLMMTIALFMDMSINGGNATKISTERIFATQTIKLLLL